MHALDHSQDSLTLQEHDMTVLVVSDSLSTQSLVSDSLGDYYRVLQAKNTHSTFALLEHNSIDLFIVDATKPQNNAIDLCQQIQTTFQKEFIPVFLLRNPEDKESATSAAHALLSLSITPQELLFQTRTFLALRKQEKQRISQVQSLKEVVSQEESLLSVVLHDLRNPLTGVLGFLGILERELRSTTLAEDVNYALKEAHRLRELLEDIFYVNQLEKDSSCLQIQLGSTESIMKKILQKLKESAKIKKIGMQVDSKEDHSFLCDAKLLGRTLENLIENSINYSRPGNVVILKTQKCEQDIIIEIRDRGLPIPPSLQNKFFDKLVETKKLSRRGRGMGIYLVKLVIEAHRGSIKIIQENETTVFRIALPIHNDVSAFF